MPYRTTSMTCLMTLHPAPLGTFASTRHTPVTARCTKQDAVDGSDAQEGDDTPGLAPGEGVADDADEGDEEEDDDDYGDEDDEDDEGGPPVAYDDDDDDDEGEDYEDEDEDDEDGDEDDEDEGAGTGAGGKSNKDVLKDFYEGKVSGWVVIVW
jgi:hypothetical protein